MFCPFISFRIQTDLTFNGLYSRYGSSNIHSARPTQVCTSITDRIWTALSFGGLYSPCGSLTFHSTLMMCTVPTDRLTDCISLCILDMSVLKCKDCVKFLRVLIDKNLTWRPHIDRIPSKISKIVQDTQRRKRINVFDDVWSMKINVFIVIANFISHIFINRLPGYLFLAQKIVETILQPFSIQWGGDHAVLLKINIQCTFEY